MPRRRPMEETARFGRALYERVVAPQLDVARADSYVALDIDSGEWTIAERDIDACDELYERCPGAVNVYIARVGYRAAVWIRRAETGSASPIEAQRPL